ncbi:Translation initiation factor 2 [uncultured Gammaproteobacteria bacterium]|jgi:translation initiation factor IF-2|uniref:Translation initiation factor 2 n=3 Tax=sulfur-oxidizing symbionts TaxID=32036 RepID=A0ACA8ZQP3_9GAMM|nr:MULTISPECIES: translation initiation factor IF-2 [sulfur-oxidizing symbionts]CAC9510962.1 Translation initiation factor 2 [uncultured Gammaproteobacteria bacterium]CAB5499573.1 Translation initiation factor 2 [Bathymodiolus azoricus thioautotrophic gill symbiont]CAB5500173.1 Translation initiation factor 2 [Bathymodiolus thermophilus thioautotrophic gill symbiont]CAC9527476.1 Translation initiation factor 2 [uncultured Gammaproteobacteria bacterium]CAC9530401.1 Translation initiation factor
MATVQSLSTALKKTPDEVIEILVNAGIEGKTANSEISGDERKILMAGLSKRGPAKSSISVSRKPSTQSSDSAGGVKIQVKKKRSVKAPITSVQDDVAVLKAKEALEALEAGREADEKLLAQDAKRQEMTRLQKEEAEDLKKQQEQAKQQTENTKKTGDANSDDKSKKPKRLRNTSGADGRKQLHVAKKNPSRKLKKKDRTRLSQKIQEEQAQHGFQKPIEKVVHEVSIPDNIKVSDLAQKMATKAGEALKVLMGMGVMATLNDVIDQDTALLVVEEMGHTGVVSKEETIEDKLIEKSKASGNESARPPVVTIMGHVDHGKTSLLDYIRKAKVADGEAGGITQHIGAYQVHAKDGKITFVDTPGHAAFSKMRSRGASTTDIVILVVAADDGVMPQTIESIKHAKNAKAPIIVAINKIDKEGANLDKVKQELSSHDVISEEWGGDVMMVGVSAHTGEGIDALLDAITLTAEISEFSAVTKGPAQGRVLEARLEKGRGKVTTILVQSGTLKKGDIMIAGLEYGKVKQIVNDQGEILKEATPSTPVEVLGLSGVPDSGDEVLVVESERKAREVADFRKARDRESELQKQQASKMDNFLQKMEEGDISTVNVLLKSDVRGSAQALVEALEELSTDEVRVKVVSSGVGGINNTDINLAATSDALVLGFNVRADAMARKTADEEGVRIEYYSIIYNLIDDVKAIMSGLLSPELSENIIGIANVKEVFKSQKLGDIAGCMVEEGVVKKDSPIRVLRDNVVVFEGELESLRRFKDSVKEVKSGTECGIGVVGYDVEAGDQIEVFERVESARTL